MGEKRDFSDIGIIIKEALQDAAETGDFGQINRVINETVGSAMDEVRYQVNEAHKRMNNGHGSQQEKFSRQSKDPDGQQIENDSREGTDYYVRYRRQVPKYPNRHTRQVDYRYQAAEKYRTASGVPVYGNRNQTGLQKVFHPNGKVSGILYTVFGGIGLGIFGITALAMFLCLVSGVSVPVASLISFGVLAAGSGFMLNRGVGLQARVKRAQRYLNLARKDMYMRIEELASHTGRSVRQVRKDVRKMLQTGIFPQGHMDEQEKFLILDNETWEQYLIEEKEFQEQQRIGKGSKSETNQTDKAGKKDEAEAAEETLSPEQQLEREIEQDGQAFMERLRELNVEIPGEVISNKLYQLDYILKRIFMVLKEKPEKCPQMRKFMDYYLPTTVKLVEAYAEFDRAGVQGENIRTARAEIEKTMDTINQAFEKLLDDMYQDAAFEAAADAKVLKTVLAQDGYTKSEFATETQDFFECTSKEGEE